MSCDCIVGESFGLFFPIKLPGMHRRQNQLFRRHQHLGRSRPRSGHEGAGKLFGSCLKEWTYRNKWAIMIYDAELSATAVFFEHTKVYYRWFDCSQSLIESDLQDKDGLGIYHAYLMIYSHFPAARGDSHCCVNVQSVCCFELTQIVEHNSICSLVRCGPHETSR